MLLEDTILWKEDFVFFFDPSNEKRKVDGRCLSINSDRDNFGFDSLQFRSIDIGRNHSDGIEYALQFHHV